MSLKSIKYCDVFLLVLTINFISCNCNKKQPAQITQLHNKEHYEPNWNSLRKHQTPQWLKDAKFGIYSHLTLRTLSNVEGNKDKMPHELINDFKLEKFNAAEWAEMFKNAGAKFAGPVAWHGSGMVHWESDLTDFNTVKMGPKIDIVGSLKKEIKARDMKFITSYHSGYWYKNALREMRPEYYAPKYKDLYGPVHDIDRRDSITNKNHIEKQEKRSQEFMDEWLAKMNEAITKYQPDITWVDTNFGGSMRARNKGFYKNGRLIDDKEIYLGGFSESHERRYISHFYNTGEQTGNEVEFVYKEYDVPPGVGMRNFENGLIDELTYDVWMTDIDICSPTSWFYKDNVPIRSANEIVDILVDVVSKNGVLLLNIPPKPDGSFADYMKKEVNEVGDWLAKNGEAIYGTMPWMIFGEGPSRLKETGHYSERYPNNAVYNEKDIRFTQKDNFLYAICLGNPDNEITIKTLGNRGKLFEGDIKSISLLGNNKKLEYEHKPYGLTIKLPTRQTEEKAVVFKIERIK